MTRRGLDLVKSARLRPTVGIVSGTAWVRGYNQSGHAGTPVAISLLAIW
jgi:hypothetical protein